MHRSISQSRRSLIHVRRTSTHPTATHPTRTQTKPNKQTDPHRGNTATPTPTPTAAGRLGLLLLCSCLLLLLSLPAFASSALDINNSNSDNPLPNLSYLQVTMLWEEEAPPPGGGGGGRAVRAAAAGPILDEVAASLCHVRRRHAGLRGVFEGAGMSAGSPSAATAVVAYCAPDDAGDGSSSSVRRRRGRRLATAESLRARCINSFYRGALASEVHARTVGGLELLKVACRICATQQMGVPGTGCV